jgi:agmatinase
VNTKALFFPFDLFGSPGTSSGAELLADAFRELLADNERESVPTRARAYQGQVQVRELGLATLRDYDSWRGRARQAIRRVLRKPEFLLWVTGNHLGVLPVYEELATLDGRTLVIQLDAHLDIYNLSDCTAELSHGNFLLHSSEPLPGLINLGTRELLLCSEYVKAYYQRVFPAAELAIHPDLILRQLRQTVRRADRVFLDIDCDVFDPAFFPAVSHALPFGISPQLLLRVLDAVWCEQLAGVALSEFDPARDRKDQSLATLVWLLEYLLLKRYEKPKP